MEIEQLKVMKSWFDMGPILLDLPHVLSTTIVVCGYCRQQRDTHLIKHNKGAQTPIWGLQTFPLLAIYKMTLPRGTSCPTLFHEWVIQTTDYVQNMYCFTP